MDTPEREPEPLKNTIPPDEGPVRVIGWEWGREEDRRPRLPWIGVFLVVYGALLLVDRLAPQYLTASAVPGLVEGATGQEFGQGFGTLCYGVALLFIGAVRMTRGGGVGWQALIGVLLVALGGSELALPDAASLVLPVLLVVFGLVLLTRDRSNLRG